jgi:branched-chain amino acid transport system ATP-binding protein
VIEARDLRVRYSRGPLVLDGVTVVAHRDEVVAVIGPNGSGKSTLLRVIAGLVAPEAGTVRVNHDSIVGLPPHRRAARGISYAPEHARILPRLSVLENLAIGAWLRRDRREVARDLERVFEWFPALRERRRRPAESLSGGERQMLALGRALLSAPQVLLLDELLAGLDTDARARLGAIVRMLGNEHVAILLAEHDPFGVRDIADRVYGLRGGRIVCTGSPGALERAGAFSAIYD